MTPDFWQNLGMEFQDLIFEPIDTEIDGEIAVFFREESYLVSYEDEAEAMAAFGGDDEYLTWVQRKEGEFSNSMVHVWQNGVLVGQVELTPRVDLERGHVNLYYVAPDWRGQGIAERLDMYAQAYFARMGIPRMSLSVAKMNKRALAFYKKAGWQEIGDDPRDSGKNRFLWMEKDVPLG